MKREFKPTHPKRGLSDKAVQFLPACAAIAMFFAVGDGRAVEPDYQVIQVTVMLDDALIIGRPWHHGTQALVEVEPGGPTNFISLTGNETVLGVYPARPIGEPGMSDAGPWVIRVGTTSDPEPVRSQVEATLPVRTSKLPNLQEPEVNGRRRRPGFRTRPCRDG